MVNLSMFPNLPSACVNTLLAVFTVVTLTTLWNGHPSSSIQPPITLLYPHLSELTLGIKKNPNTLKNVIRKLLGLLNKSRM